MKLCFDCWEIKHNKTLHNKRFRKLEKVIKAKSFQKFGVNFNYDKLIDEFDDYGIYNKLKNKKPKTEDIKSKPKPIVCRENTLEEITSYLKLQEVKRRSIQFWYRDDAKPRIIDDYYLDERYINVRSDKGYFIKFLIDKIRRI